MQVKFCARILLLFAFRQCNSGSKFHCCLKDLGNLLNTGLLGNLLNTGLRFQLCSPSLSLKQMKQTKYTNTLMYNCRFLLENKAYFHKNNLLQVSHLSVLKIPTCIFSNLPFFSASLSTEDFPVSSITSIHGQ